MTVNEVKAKRLPELDDEFATQAAGFDTLDELREDIVTRLREADEAAVEREFEQAVLDAAVGEAEIEVPSKLVHARAHELLDQTLEALARQGISKDAYLQITGKDEESMAHEAEPEAEAILNEKRCWRRWSRPKAIEPSDEELIEAIRPIAERDGRKPAEGVGPTAQSGPPGSAARGGRLAQGARSARLGGPPITVEQARHATSCGPGEVRGAGSGQLWTPGS